MTTRLYREALRRFFAGFFSFSLSHSSMPNGLVFWAATNFCERTSAATVFEHQVMVPAQAREDAEASISNCLFFHAQSLELRLYQHFEY